jgi:hypothetical protein
VNNANGFDHVHGFVRVRFGPIPVLGAALYLLLGRLGLQRGWMVRAGDLPHDPECTPTEGVIRQ